MKTPNLFQESVRKKYQFGIELEELELVCFIYTDCRQELFSNERNQSLLSSSSLLSKTTELIVYCQYNEKSHLKSSTHLHSFHIINNNNSEVVCLNEISIHTTHFNITATC